MALRRAVRVRAAPFARRSSRLASSSHAQAVQTASCSARLTRMVGVVPNAAYRHFPDRYALAAVRDAAIRQLAHRMAQGVRRVRAQGGT